VPTNPTSAIVERLKQVIDQYDDGDDNDRRKNTVSSSDVEVITLETSAKNVKKRMDEIFCDIIQKDLSVGSEDDGLPPSTTNGHLQGNDITNASLQKTRCSNFVIIHMGVDASSSCIKLETRAYNEATFRVPDEDGYRPSEVCIDSSQSLGTILSSTLDLDWVCADVNNRRRHCGKSDGDVQLSSDAGRFVCNYTYWYSLNRARDRTVTNICSNGGLDVTEPSIDVVFVHVPPFNVQSIENQMDIIVHVMNSICQSISDVDIKIPYKTVPDV